MRTFSISSAIVAMMLFTISGCNKTDNQSPKDDAVKPAEAAAAEEATPKDAKPEAAKTGSCEISKNWELKVPCDLLKINWDSAKDGELPKVEIPFLKVKDGKDIKTEVENYKNTQCVGKKSIKTASGLTAQMFVCGFGCDCADESELEESLLKHTADLKWYLSIHDPEAKEARIFTVYDGSKEKPFEEGASISISVDMKTAESVELMGTTGVFIDVHRYLNETYEHDGDGDIDYITETDYTYLFAGKKTRYVTFWERKVVSSERNGLDCGSEKSDCDKREEKCQSTEYVGNAWKVSESPCK